MSRPRSPPASNALAIHALGLLVFCAHQSNAEEPRPRLPEPREPQREREAAGRDAPRADTVSDAWPTQLEASLSTVRDATESGQPHVALELLIQAYQQQLFCLSAHYAPCKSDSV